MIKYNQTQQNNIFSLFPKYDLEQASSVNKANVSNIKSDIKNPSDELVVKNSDTKKTGKAKRILFGSTLASTILTAGVISLFFAKGFHGSSLSKLSGFREKLAQEIQNQNAATKDIAANTTYYARKGAKKTIDTMQATSNFTAIKDWLADKAFRTNRATTKFADKSTSLFKKIVDKTLGKKYDKVEIKVKDLTSLLKYYNADSIANLSAQDRLQEITIKGKTKTLEEWSKILASQTKRLETNFDKNFSLGARRLRDKKRSGLLADLPEKIRERFFKDKNSLFNPEAYKTYATEDLTKAAREELREEILRARKQVTNNIPTIHDDIKTALNSFSQTIKPNDESARDAVQMLKKQLELFKTCSGKNEAVEREKISKEISNIVETLTGAIKKSSIYSGAEQEEMLKNLSSIQDTVLSTGIGSKGALEEIMTIIKGLNTTNLQSSGKKIITDSHFKELSKLSSKITTGLEKATELETGEYFLKQAELKVGSAPTDVLSVLFPIGVGAYSIAKGDDKDEKISATLTTCVPLVGTFATFVYGTTKMFSGAKNLAFSFVSGLVLGKLGNYCDKLYKKYKDSGSVVDVVKNEYDNFWMDVKPPYAQPIKEEKK